MDKISRSFFTKAKSFDNAEGETERNPLLFSKSCSCGIENNLNTWGQVNEQTSYFLTSETIDLEPTSNRNGYTSIKGNTFNNKNNQIQGHEKPHFYNSNIKPLFQKESSSTLFNYDNKYTKYKTITTSTETDFYYPLSTTDNKAKLYSPVASMTDEEDIQVKITSSKMTTNSSDNIRSSDRSNEYDSGEGPKQNSIVTIFSIWNTMVGTSLLAMPWGMERAGLLTGFLIAIIMGGICLYTAYCNIDAQRQHGSIGGEVFQLSKLLLGPWAERIAKVFSYLVLLGAVIIYWILMSNFFNFTVDFLFSLIFIEDHPPIPSFFDETVLCPSSSNKIIKNISSLPMTDTVFNSSELLLLKSITNNQLDKFHEYWNLKTVPIILALIVGPLLCFRSPTFFTKFNSLGTLSVMYLMLFIFIKSLNWGFVNVSFTDNTSIHQTELFNSAFGAMCGMLSLSYFIHNIIISIMRNNRYQTHNARDLSIAYVLVTITYTFIGALFYVSFPIEKHCIEDNLLNNFQITDPMTVIARVFLFFQLVTVYPLIAFMLRSQILSELTGTMNPSFKILTAFNVILVIICILFAIFIPHIGTVIRFTGAISGFIHVFSLPCLLRIASLKKTGSLTICKLLLNLVIPLLGAINILLQFFTKDK